MPFPPERNKFRRAIDVLQRGRDVLVDQLAEDVLDQAEDLVDGGFQFNEFLETQGTRLHFLGLLVAQLEQSAETAEERDAPAAEPEPAPPAPKAPRKRKPRAKKVASQASTEGQADD